MNNYWTDRKHIELLNDLMTSTGIDYTNAMHAIRDYCHAYGPFTIGDWLVFPVGVDYDTHNFGWNMLSQPTEEQVKFAAEQWDELSQV